MHRCASVQVLRAQVGRTLDLRTAERHCNSSREGEIFKCVIL